MDTRQAFTLTRTLSLIGIGMLGCMTVIMPANALNLAQAPLSITASQPPLILMTMARDHKLYYEAYNDYSDLDEDGTLDLVYKPDNIDYYGYFDSNKCYDYVSGIFTPVAVTSNKKCTGSNDTYWSGDFLNYVTTSRMDAIRKVFYGGKRSTDTSTTTVLERAFIPQDAHTWGKEYESIARDGYDVRDYTPLSLPQSGYRHLFANVTLTSDTSPPLMRVLNDSTYRIWEWVSIERPVAGTKCLHGSSGPNCATSGGATWNIIPSSSSHGLSNLTMTTYNTGTAANPNSQSEFDSLETTYGSIARRCGSGSVSTIDGSGNPYDPGTPTLGTCSDDNYMSIFTGTLNIATDGTYTFGIDGDDSVDLFIDGTQRIGWYGGHSQTGSPPTHTVSITLAAGAHTIKFRHHEKTGDDTYHLYWRPTTPASVITDYIVRVEVCKTLTGVDADHYEGRESNCQGYGTSSVVYKPTGLLHKYGQNDAMYFGLITGSYDQNTDGGILRKEVSSITNEIESSTGIFKETGSTCGISGSTSCTKGIVGTIDRLKITSFSYSSYDYSCGWITTQPMSNGQCEMWGNPLGEMMYEGLRYFAGKSSATSSYTTSSTRDNALGLPKVTWGSSTNPYGTGKFPYCSKPYFMLISDVYPSFDSDKIPGANSTFGSFTGDIASLSVSTLGQNIWDFEFGTGVAKDIFIGQVGTTYDGAPTAKTASSFGNIRGLAPGEPTRQGSYYSASIAYFGHVNDINDATGGQKTTTYSIALSSPLPKIEIPVDGHKVVFVPFAKSVGGSSISAAQGSFQPTNQIVDFYVDTVNNTTAGNTNAAVNGGRPYYKFRINYEDVEQGADHDMDAIATYEIKLNADNTVTVSISSDYAAGGIIQHMGYVVSGTSADGVYLEVRDKDTDAGSDPDYFLDTPNTAGVALPLSSSRTFTPSSTSSAATILQDPLWYAAKFGGFSDDNGDKVPQTAEWDANNDGIPDNYFLVVNPLKMLTQMDKALAKISSASGASAAAAASSTSFQSDSRLFLARLNSDGWSGELNAYPVSESGASSAVWKAQVQLTGVAGDDRIILTYDVDKPSARGIPFRWSSMTTTSPASLQTALNKRADGTVDTLGPNRVTYLRGDSVSGMRTRPTISGTSETNKLGDIVNSSPRYVAKPSLGYGETSYATFSANNASRTAMIYVGANDGMLHGFKAATGDELLAYVPSEMYRTRDGQQPLSKLTQTDYGKSGNAHRYYVDGSPVMGDICTGDCTTVSQWKTILVGGLNAGGQGVYALDITNPANFTEANASSIVKWEFLDHDHDGDASASTITGDAELGYTFGRPAIVKLCTSRESPSSVTPAACSAYGWYVIFGNGYNNTELDGYAGTGDAVLFVLNADTGHLVRKIALNVASGTDPNGLSEVTPIDIDGDRVTDYVYAGDLKGNFWRFDFVSDDPDEWGAAFGSSSAPEPLYVARDEQTTPVRQPITTSAEALAHPLGGALLLFGTGRYIDAGDPSTTQGQTFYGIWDKFNGSTVASTNRNNLQQQSVYSTTLTQDDTQYLASTSNTVDWSTKKGWYLNLPATGERITYNPLLINGEILRIVSTKPSSDVCEAGGTTRSYYLDALTGARLSWAVFDDMADLHNFDGTSAYSNISETTGISAPGTILHGPLGRAVSFTGTPPGGCTGTNCADVRPPENINTGATGNRLSWREILND